MPRPWGVHPGVAHGAAILGNLERTTGRDREAWLALARAAGSTDLKAARTFFREHGVTLAAAGFLAELAAGGEVATAESYLAACDGYVAEQYAGRKAALRPLFEALLERAYALGPDVRACPCRTIVPLYRQRVFAEVKPFAGRLALGLALGDPALLRDRPARLLDTGGFAKKDRLTVKLEVRTLTELDGELGFWLERAYALDRQPVSMGSVFY